MTTLETLFSPAQKEKLTKAAFQRTSCRAYAAPPDTAELAALSYAAGRYALPRARVVVQATPETLFTPAMLGMLRVSGCTTAAVVIARENDPVSTLHAGIAGEALTLEATAMGLGSCWVAGTYRRKLLQVALEQGEAVLAVIALGHPRTPLPEGNVQRRRKPVERLFRGDLRLCGVQVQQAAKLVREAPSAMNMQPWQLSMGPENAFVVDVRDRSLLDAGIALCHAELALLDPHAWHYGAGKNAPTAWAVPLRRG